MNFRITGLPAERFERLFALCDAELAEHAAVRLIADARTPGVPCRVSLTDAQPGDELVLVNYEHHPVDSPYRMRFAIYVRKGERVGAIGLVSKRAVSDRRFSGELLTLGDRMRRRARVVTTDMIEDESVIFPRKTKHWRTVFREGAHGAHNGTSTPCGRRQERTLKRPFGRPDNFG